MNSKNINQELIKSADDDEYRIYCNICAKLCIEGFYKNQLKSSTRLTKIRTRQHLNNTNTKNTIKYFH